METKRNRNEIVVGQDKFYLSIVTKLSGYYNAASFTSPSTQYQVRIWCHIAATYDGGLSSDKLKSLC
jgi:hypothetical protein